MHLLVFIPLALEKTFGIGWIQLLWVSSGCSGGDKSGLIASRQMVTKYAFDFWLYSPYRSTIAVRKLKLEIHRLTFEVQWTTNRLLGKIKASQKPR